jgi:hypothetical protein
MSKGKGEFKVNLRECMSFLLSKADPYAMLESKPVWPILKEIAAAETTIDIYNKETWGKDKKKFDPVFDVVHRIIGLYGHQQQLTEGYVKSMADQARTNVSERRRNVRITTHSYSKREFNKSVKKVKGQKEGVKTNNKFAVGTAHFLDQSQALVCRYHKETKHFGAGAAKTAMNRFNSVKKRSGERDKDKKAARITSNLALHNDKQSGDATKGATYHSGHGRSGCNVRAHCSQGRVQHLKAELIVRGVATERELVNMKVNEMKAKLKEHELGERKNEFPLMEMTAIHYISSLG